MKADLIDVEVPDQFELIQQADGSMASPQAEGIKNALHVRRQIMHLLYDARILEGRIKKHESIVLHSETRLDSEPLTEWDRMALESDRDVGQVNVEYYNAQIEQLMLEVKAWKATLVEDGT